MAAGVKPCIVSCSILREEITRVVEQESLDVDLHFLDEKLHFDYSRLHKALSGTLEKLTRKCSGSVIVVYGDVCLGFNNEMKELIDRYHVIKVDALNCIDCSLGGGGKLLEIDPGHEYFFLNPAFIRFTDWTKMGTREEVRKMFGALKGIVLLDPLGNLDDYREEIEKIADYTGLPILERKDVGLAGVRKVILDALKKLEEQTGKTG
jgi:hypothetical protein